MISATISSGQEICISIINMIAYYANSWARLHPKPLLIRLVAIVSYTQTFMNSDRIITALYKWWPNAANTFCYLALIDGFDDGFKYKVSSKSKGPDPIDFSIKMELVQATE